MMMSNCPKGVQSGSGPLEFIIFNNIPEESKNSCRGTWPISGISNEGIGMAVRRISAPSRREEAGGPVKHHTIPYTVVL
jgi:hypothetical protein